MSYGYLATMRTKAGHRDDVVQILLSGDFTGQELTVVGGLR